MTLRELEIFIEVANTKSMSLAAENLKISQPTVSHCVAEIEKEFNVVLFKRISKKLYITETGLNLYRYGIRLNSLFNDTISFLQHSSKSNILNIGASANLNFDLISKAVEKFESNNKNLETKIYIENSETIISKIKEGSIDIGFCDGDIVSEDIISEEFYKEELVLICSKYSKFYGYDEISIEDIKNEDFALREEGSGSREHILKILREEKIPINIKWSSSNLDAIIQIVKNTKAISILPDKDLDERIFKLRIKGRKIYSKFKVIYSKDKHLSKELKELIENVKNIKKERN